MSDQPPANAADETSPGVLVRYWAAARSAAGVDSETVPVEGDATLAKVLETVRLRHRDSPRFKDVVGVCSVVVGDRPVGTTDHASVVLRPGDTVELLPPFAGG